MLFDIYPKEELNSLFGRDEELRTIENHIRNRRWIALLGTRMVGKTSLLKGLKTKLENERLPVLYVNLWGIHSINELVEAITLSINNTPLISERIKTIFSRISGVSIGPLGISIKERKKPLSLTRELLSSLGKIEKGIVIILDEVQELQYATNHLLNLLANIFYTYSSITFCFTGTFFGLMKSLLEPKFDSPMYGRSPANIYIQPFSEETSLEFLKQGFKELNKTVPIEELKQVVNRFDGIPGWLTLYGNSVAISGYSHSEALRFVEKEAFKIQESVLKHYLEKRNKKIHLAVLKAVTMNPSWTEIKNSVERFSAKPINDATLKNIIDALTASFFIKKSGEFYQIIDPAMRRFLLTEKSLNKLIT